MKVSQQPFTQKFCNQNYRAWNRSSKQQQQSRQLRVLESEQSLKPKLPPLNGDYEQLCMFKPYANWLLPGRVMLGRYPFVEPSRCPERPKGEQQLQEILDAGVDVFCCLQAEIPSQEHMKVGGEFQPYKAPAELIASSLTGVPPIEIIEGLRNPYLDQFLPEKRRKTYEDYRKRLEFLYFPIEDLDIPDLIKFASFVKKVQSKVELGSTLYIHCWGGRGRAGTLGACLLIQMYGISADEALKRVQRSFDTRQDGGLSPETAEQFRFVKEYKKKILKL